MGAASLNWHSAAVEDDDEDIEQTHLSGRLLWAILVALPFGLGGCALAFLGVRAIFRLG